MSVLERKEEEYRPYSRKELEDSENKGLSRLRVGNHFVRHPDCGHSYLLRSGGRKEELWLSTGKQIAGYCSVCWKLEHTPNQLKNRAKQLITEYNNYDCKNFFPPKSAEALNLELDFYM